jgi:hypothetical protein
MFLIFFHQPDKLPTDNKKAHPNPNGLFKKFFYFLCFERFDRNIGFVVFFLLELHNSVYFSV